jgi:hypothetical protein
MFPIELVELIKPDLGFYQTCHYFNKFIVIYYQSYTLDFATNLFFSRDNRIDNLVFNNLNLTKPNFDYIYRVMNFKGGNFKNLTHVTLESDFNQQLIFPESVIYLRLGSKYDHPLSHLPKLKILICGVYYRQPLQLPETLEELYLGFYYNQPLVFPKNLKILHLNKHFNQPIILPNLKQLTIYNVPENIIYPKSLKIISFGYDFNQDVDLSNTNLVRVNFGYKFNSKFILPETIKILKLPNKYNLPIDFNSLPKSLETIKKLGNVYNIKKYKNVLC